MSGEKNQDEVRKIVRERYAGISASSGTMSCCGPATTCCGPSPAGQASQAVGYSPEELAALPEGANLGLGCGNPQAIAALRPGEVVLDLGSGGGIDCFLAAKQVGQAGSVIGVDMTPEMVERARLNAAKAGFDNVAFRLGEIEHLPVADASVDVIISNCVINLSPDKPAVYADAFRVLTPGGRLAVSDVVLIGELPEGLRQDAEMLSGCVAGASTVAAIESMLNAAGFTQIKVEIKPGTRDAIAQWAPGTGIENFVASANIIAVKPQDDAVM